MCLEKKDQETQNQALPFLNLIQRTGIFQRKGQLHFTQVLPRQGYKNLMFADTRQGVQRPTHSIPEKLKVVNSTAKSILNLHSH